MMLACCFSVHASVYL